MVSALSSKYESSVIFSFVFVNIWSCSGDFPHQSISSHLYLVFFKSSSTCCCLAPACRRVRKICISGLKRWELHLSNIPPSLHYVHSGCAKYFFRFSQFFLHKETKQKRGKSVN